jgi:hypothetical protein
LVKLLVMPSPNQQVPNSTIWVCMRMKARKKEPNNVWIVLKNCFWIFEKSPAEHYISQKLFYFLNKFLYFQSYNCKSFMKIHHVSRVFLYV